MMKINIELEDSDFDATQYAEFTKEEKLNLKKELEEVALYQIKDKEMLEDLISEIYPEKELEE